MEEEKKYYTLILHKITIEKYLEKYDVIVILNKRIRIILSLELHMQNMTFVGILVICKRKKIGTKPQNYE